MRLFTKARSIHLLALGLAASAAFGQRQVPRAIHMNISFNGNKVGTADFADTPDGKFSGKTLLALGPTKIESEIKGEMKAGKLVTYDWTQNRPGANVKLHFANGKLGAIGPDGKTKDLPFDGAVDGYVGNLIPQLSETILKRVNVAKKTAQTFKAYMIDAGAGVSLQITPLLTKATTAGKVQQYQIRLGMLTLDYYMTEDGRVVAVDVPSQKLRFIEDGWSALFIDPFEKYPELSQGTLKSAEPRIEKLTTRDGVQLAQTIYLPEGAGKYPTIFERTPYGRSAEGILAAFYTTRGYAYVVQDCRGRGDSTGSFDPFVTEANDGYDSINWIAKQPWCDGNVGMIGASYGGFVQWAAASQAPAALKCIVPQVSPPLDAMTNLPYDHGIFFLWGDIWWGNIVHTKDLDPSKIFATLPNPEGFKTLPLAKTPKSVLGFEVPFYEKWLDRTGLKDWQGWNFYRDLDRVTIPALHISGWWDGDEIGTNLNWEAMRARKRQNQWLIYGPWSHLFNTDTKLGDTDFGPSAIIDLDTLYIRWFDTWLKHKDVGIANIPHVQAFVTGANKWVSFSDWPAPTSTTRSLYFGSEGSGHGLKGGGQLLPKIAGKQSVTQITYDPKVAVIPQAILKVDPSKASMDVTKGLEAPGSLVFKSDVLRKTTAISGPYEVQLHFRTSARDTDFYAALIDIDEKGHSRAFGTTGKIRASYIGGLDRPRPLTPNRDYVAKIKPWDSAHELKAGHRLGVLIICTGFPMFARNLGTGEPIKNATRMIVQKNQVLHDPKHPSKLTFQVLWEK